MNFFELGLGRWSAVTVNRKVIVALKLLYRRRELIRSGGCSVTGKVTQIIQACDLAGDFVNGIQVTDLDGNCRPVQSGLVVFDNKHAAGDVRADVVLDL